MNNKAFSSFPGDGDPRYNGVVKIFAIFVLLLPMCTEAGGMRGISRIPRLGAVAPLAPMGSFALTPTFGVEAPTWVVPKLAAVGRLPIPVIQPVPEMQMERAVAEMAAERKPEQVIVQIRRYAKKKDWNGLFENGLPAPPSVNAAAGNSISIRNPLKGAWRLLRLKEAHHPTVAGATLALAPLVAIPSVGSYALHEYFHFLALKFFKVRVGSMRYFYIEQHSWDSFTSGGYVNHAAMTDPRREFWVALAGPIGSVVHFALMSVLFGAVGNAFLSVMASKPLLPGTETLAAMGLTMVALMLAASWFFSGIKAITAFGRNKSDMREARAALRQWKRGY